MSDTVFETAYDGRRLSFTRFWRHGDWIQITTNQDYGIMPYGEFLKAVEAIKENVEETKDAWWHYINKEKDGNVT